MANMSASILRELVAKVFNIKATQVILSGELSPTTIFQNDRGHSWWGGASHCIQTVFGFNPNLGFKRICGEWNMGLGIANNEFVLKRDYAYSDNGEFYESKGDEIGTLENGEDFIFFFVRSNEKGYGETAETEENFYLYKAPNFSEFLAKVEEKDIARWEQWLLEE